MHLLHVPLACHVFGEAGDDVAYLQCFSFMVKKLLNMIL